MKGLVRISDFWGTASKSKSPKMLALKILAVVGWIESQMLECPLVLAGINSWPLCLCCPFKPPPCVQTCACTPLRPLHLQRRKFDWTPAQASTDSPSLSADLAHERLWQLARWAEFQTPPTPLLFPVPFFYPLKNSLLSSVGMPPRRVQQQSWRQCSCVMRALRLPHLAQQHCCYNKLFEHLETNEIPVCNIIECNETWHTRWSFFFKVFKG